MRVYVVRFPRSSVHAALEEVTRSFHTSYYSLRGRRVTVQSNNILLWMLLECYLYGIFIHSWLLDLGRSSPGRCIGAVLDEETCKIRMTID